MPAQQGQARESLPSPTGEQRDGLATPEAETNREAIAEIVGLLVESCREEGKRNLAIGRKTLHHAQWQKGHFPDFGDAHFDALCRKIADDVRLQVPIRCVKPDNYVREYAFAELVRPLVGDAIDRFPYHFLPRIAPTVMSFVKSELVGVIREGWTDWIRATVERQVGSNPAKVAYVLASLRARKQAILDDKRPLPTPDEILRRERRAALARRTGAEGRIRAAIDEALGGVLHGHQVADIGDAAFSKRGQRLPANPASLANMSADDAQTLVKLLANAGNVAAMATLADALDAALPAIQVRAA